MSDYELEEIYNAAIDGEGKTVFDGLRAVVMAEREACKSALHVAVLRSLDEAGVGNEVLRGMCIEVAFDKFEAERFNKIKLSSGESEA